VAPTKQNLLAEMEPTDNRRNRIANALSRLGKAASRRPWDIAGYNVILLLGKCSLLHFIVCGGDVLTIAEMEKILSDYGITPAKYRGGELNRVDCREIMPGAKTLFEQIETLLLSVSHAD
jgi:hypothetical protein